MGARHPLTTLTGHWPGDWGAPRPCGLAASSPQAWGRRAAPPTQVTAGEPGQRAPGRRVGAGFPWRLLGRAAVGTSHSAARGGQRPAAHRLVPSMEPPRPSQPATSCQLTSCTCREEAPLQGAGRGPGPLPRRRPCAQGQHALRGTEAVPAVAAQPQVKAGLRAWAGHSQGGPSPSPSSSDPSSSWTGLAAPRWCTGGPACPGETGGGL